MSNVTEKKANTKENSYNKKQFLTGEFSAFDKDILKIILKDDVKYTKEEVKKKLEEFKKKEVK